MHFTYFAYKMVNLELLVCLVRLPSPFFFDFLCEEHKKKEMIANHFQAKDHVEMHIVK